MNFYRFSIAWPRVLPNGDVSSVSEAGLAYYDKVINKCLEHGLQPMVTMYHFDLPQALQELGGWPNSYVVPQFEGYADLLYRRFGDRVKYWITFNEPADFCVAGYGNSVHAPGVNANGVGEYLCAHNVLKAHAVTYRLYEKKYKEKFNGKVGIAITTRFFFSETNRAEDIDRAMQFSVSWKTRIS